MAPPAQKLELSIGEQIVLWLALGLGAGRSPWAPGTAGTLVAIPLYWLMASWSLPVYVGVVAVMAVAGVGLCGRAAALLNRPDPSAVVWDEIVGYLITMTAAPSGWLWLVIGFGLFRLFDIAKPWPISWLDRHIPGGWGIMLDDIAAGLLAWGILQGLATAWVFTGISGLRIG